MRRGHVGELLAYDIYIGGIGNHPEIGHGTHSFEAVDSELYEGAATTQNIDKLFGEFRGAERPESAPDTAGHDDYLVVHSVYFCGG